MVRELLADRGGAGLLSLDIINDSRNRIQHTIWDFTYMQSFRTQSLSVHFSYVCESKKDYSLQWTTWRDYLT